MKKTTERRTREFVGGPYDGRQHEVLVIDPQRNTRVKDYLVIYPDAPTTERMIKCARYRLGEGGRMHYIRDDYQPNPSKGAA